MARIGYARVSTTDQDLDGQLAKLHEEGCEVVRAEKVLGASREGRPYAHPPPIARFHGGPSIGMINSYQRSLA